MGFEVLDARGDSTAASSAVEPAPVDVLDLDDDVTLTDTSEPPRWHRARSALGGVRHAGPEVLLPALAALVVGALLGGFVTGQQAASDERTARRSELAVVAQVESSSISELAGSVRAEITARVTNSGPEPVELVTDVDGSTPSEDKPVVVTSDGESTGLAPGAGSSVRLAVKLACRGNSVPDLAVTVRTSDGRPHLVPLRSSGSVSTMSALCSNVSAATPSVDAWLRGTTARPVLVIVNGRDTAVRVSLGSPRSLNARALRGLLRVRVTPALPTLIGAGDQRQLPFEVEAVRCVEDLEVLSQLGEISSYPLVVSGPSGEPLPDESSRDALGTQVDLGLLVTQALARACRE